MGLTPRLEARPGVRLLSYLSLLPASAVELDATIDRAVVDNPLLERVPWRACPTCGLATAGDRCPACATARWQVEPVAAPDWRTELLGDAAAELPTGLRPALELRGRRPRRPRPPPRRARSRPGDARCGAGGSPHGRPTRHRGGVPGRLRARAGGRPGRGRTRIGARVRGRRSLAAARWPRSATSRSPAPSWVHESEVRAAVDVLRADTTPYVALSGGPTRSAPTDVVFTHPAADGPGGRRRRRRGLGLGSAWFPTCSRAHRTPAPGRRPTGRPPP